MNGKPIELYLDEAANHRALRRCHGCGSYTRTFRQDDGAMRCERCAERERLRQENEEVSERVEFIV
ncbi:MAG TPA: hypothetical protein VIE39_08220 [Thermoanaerobaculia bacterium]